MFQIAAISQQASETDEASSKDHDNSSNRLGWKSFDMRSVVSATEDLFQFILSRKGSRVRVFLVRDLLKAADTFLEDGVLARCSEENSRKATSLESEVRL